MYVTAGYQVKAVVSQLTGHICVKDRDRHRHWLLVYSVNNSVQALKS